MPTSATSESWPAIAYTQLFGDGSDRSNSVSTAFWAAEAYGPAASGLCSPLPPGQFPPDKPAPLELVRHIKGAHYPPDHSATVGRSRRCPGFNFRKHMAGGGRGGVRLPSRRKVDDQCAGQERYGTAGQVGRLLFAPAAATPALAPVGGAFALLPHDLARREVLARLAARDLAAGKCLGGCRPWQGGAWLAAPAVPACRAGRAPAVARLWPLCC